MAVPVKGVWKPLPDGKPRQAAAPRWCGCGSGDGGGDFFLEGLEFYLKVKIDVKDTKR